jgi:hypothetical protein
MKKVILFLIIIIFSCTLTSCGDSYRMDKIENVVWRSDTFNITALPNQINKYPNKEQNNKYSCIYINDEKYACYVHFSWQSTVFAVKLYDENSNLEISFYGDDNNFLIGYYEEPKKEKNREYLYSCVVRLNDSGQYYDYCVANNLEFPTIINFYGYENK